MLTVKKAFGIIYYRNTQEREVEEMTKIFKVGCYTWVRNEDGSYKTNGARIEKTGFVKKGIKWRLIIFPMHKRINMGFEYFATLHEAMNEYPAMREIHESF